MKTPINIAIVGAGFAGLASATLLARAGHKVTVFERFKTPTALGAGILIQPTGLAAMRELGIAHEVLQRGAKVDRLYGVNAAGQRVIDIQYAHWRFGSYGLGVHRGVLFQALWQAAAAAGAQMETGHEVHDLAHLRGFDLQVIADGAGSRLRAQMNLGGKDRVYPWGALWAVLPDPTRRFASTLWQWYRRADQMLGIMPTGMPVDSDVPAVSLFWSVRSDRRAQVQNAGLTQWKDTVLQLNPACADLLDNIHSMEQLTWAHYHDVVLPRYHQHSAVVMGDAAHATSPQLGQGTNLALMDALAMARCLQGHNSVADALTAYSKERRGHLHFYSQASRLLTPIFQSDQSLLPWLRDKLMARSAGWPVLREANLQTLVGVRKRWWGGVYTLSE